MRRAGLGQVVGLMISLMAVFPSAAQQETALLSGEVIKGQMGLMQDGRISIVPGWTDAPLWIPVHQLWSTDFSTTWDSSSLTGYHVLLTNGDRLHSKQVSVHADEIELHTPWGTKNRMNPQVVQSIWLTPTAEVETAMWHNVIPGPGWWFQIEGNTGKLSSDKWSRAPDGSWLFGEDRKASGIRLPNAEGGIAMEVECEVPQKNFRIRLFGSLAELLDPDRPGVDLRVNTDQIMLRAQRKILFRKKVPQELRASRRLRIEYDLRQREFRFWLDDEQWDTVPFPPTISFEQPRIWVLTPAYRMRLVDLKLTPIVEEIPPGLDRLWLNEGTRMLGQLISWDGIKGIHFRPQGESKPRVFKEEDVSGIEFDPQMTTKSKRDNRDVCIQFRDGFSKLHLPLAYFSETDLSGQNIAWKDEVRIPLDQMLSIRWNPYTFRLKEPESPFAHWDGENPE